MKKLFPVLFIWLIVSCKDKPTQPFSILKVTKTTNGHEFDVQVQSRLSKTDLVAIASKIKKDSSAYDNIEIDYLLPGNSFKNLGGVTVYARINYHDARKVTALDTVKDLNDNFLMFEQVGFAPAEAKKLLSYDPADMVGKTVIGKFIDDNTKTVSLIYSDSKKENQIYILELDITGKVVSATEPMMVTHNNVQKLIISPKGDYMTVQNGMLTMYSSDDPETPYRSIKAGL